MADGLAANPGLWAAAEQSAISSARAVEAGRAYLPSLELQARYTRAAGGRTIEFPVGDLLNPAYGALNDLTGSTAFPTVQNQSFELLRKREQDTRVQLYQPLFEPSSRPAARAQRALADADGFSVSALRRDLSADIRSAYLSYLEAEQAIEIHQVAVALVGEALRVSERLVANGMATGDAVYRGRAELATVQQDQAAALTTRDLAAGVFNTLLARPIEAPIESMSMEQLVQSLHPNLELPTANAAGTIDAVTARALSNRAEILSLDASVRAATARVSLARSAFRPSVGLALDWGIQGGAYNVRSGESFRTGSVVVRWKLFDGFRRASRVEQARMAENALASRLKDARNRIQLEVRQAIWLGDLEVRNIEVAGRRLSSAQNAHRLTARRYQEGMATLLEMLDARAALTSAKIGLSMTRFAALKRNVELARVAELEN